MFGLFKKREHSSEQEHSKLIEVMYTTEKCKSKEKDADKDYAATKEMLLGKFKDRICPKADIHKIGQNLSVAIWNAFELKNYTVSRKAN